MMHNRKQNKTKFSLYFLPLAFILGIIVCTQIHTNTTPASPTPPLPIQHDTVIACFTPSMKCLPFIQNTLHTAKHSIYVQAYSFTSKSIAAALIQAHQRGVHVEVIGDKGQINARSSQIYALKAAGIPVMIDRVQGLQHNKIMIIDASTIVCGSYNFSDAAENRNAENLLVITDANLAQQYHQNWKLRQENSYLLR